MVKEVGELGSITSKATQKPVSPHLSATFMETRLDRLTCDGIANRQFAKRDLTLVDQSQHSIRLTLWGKQAENFKGDDQPVIAAKGVKVGDFGGESLCPLPSIHRETVWLIVLNGDV